MADEPDPALTGAAYDLANAGYTAMPDKQRGDQEETIGSDNASLREAAEERSASPDRLIIRAYADEDGKPVAGNEAVTLTRAARDYAGFAAAEKLVAENESSKELAARVDAMRAEALANDPDAAEFYGFELPKRSGDKSDKVKTDESVRADASSNPGSERAASKLDPEIEKVLQHPQVQQAIQDKISEAENAKHDYLNGLAAATQIAQVSFLSQFPDLAAIAPGNLQGALEQMSRQDPARYARVRAMIATTEQLSAHQQQESRRQAEAARQKFLTLARSEDARLETMLKGEPKETQRAVTSEILASAKASGIEPAELNRLYNSEPLMRNAVFQHMMYDAGKYRLMMKAKDAAATKQVPPVQRPGPATTRSEREHADIRTLTTRLSSSGDIKDAVALYKARKSNRR